MIFRIVLTLSFLGIGLYAIALRRRIPALGNTAVLVTMVAMFLTWKPDYSTLIAQAVGIGRGADPSRSPSDDLQRRHFIAQGYLLTAAPI